MIITGGPGGQTLTGGSENDTIYGYDPAAAGSVTVTPIITSGLTQPLYATYAPGDANGLYVVQKGGVITRYDTVAGTTSTFLTVTDLSFQDERGVLGVAFHPNYATNGRFFVYATDAGGDVEVREYGRNGGAGSIVANSAEVRTILTIEHSNSSNHNGGSMVFSPTNGLLYIGVGDAQNGANAQNGASLLGKILRIDVDSTDFGSDTSRYYHVPASNAFAGSSSDPAGTVNDAIFAMGVRNPWRISFDSSGNLWIGDVGEGSYEEVDFIANGSNGGINFGWPNREGAHTYNSGQTIGPGALTDPLYEYTHSVGQSITGGFVYDGPASGLQGKYIFGDFTTGKIFALEKVGSTVTVTEITSMLSSSIGAYQLASFGLDAQHNLYAIKIGGQVVLLTPQAGGGADGPDTIDGGAGADTLIGGPGDDVYITDASDTVIEQAGAGTDTVRTAQNTYTLTFANVENVTFTGSGAFNVTGNTLANVLTGGSGADTLSGGGGADTLIGSQGDDLYVIGSAGVVVTEASGQGTDTVRTSLTNYTLGANVENLLLVSTAINGTGNSANNVITGNTNANTLIGGDGADTLTGGGGADTLRGGLGDDVYMIDNAEVVAMENTSSGSDTVRSSLNTYTLGDYFDNLVLVTTALNGFGNSQNNAITGNTNANVLKGFGGNDTLDGAGGNDTVSYSAASGGVTVSLAIAGAQAIGADQGSDTLISIEYVTGSNYNDSITGSSADNVLNGGTGNDTLNGGAGADTLAGGVGDDTYIADALDMIWEYAGGGTDTIRTAANVYTLTAADVENVTFTGAGAVNLTGNTFANVLSGGASNDTFRSAGGVDTLVGGLGDDLYVIAGVAAIVTENSGEGTDTIRTSLTTYTLDANVENLILVSEALNGFGNSGNNVITGNANANVLKGFGGNDTMDGGDGSDSASYTGANAAVAVSLVIAGAQAVGADQGSDTLISIENISGSAFNDTLTGNSAANILNGWTGNDTLNGSLGADTLAGGAGSDAFVFNTALGAGNVDAITDFAAGADDIHLALTIFSAFGGTGAFAAGHLVTGAGAVAADADDLLIYNSTTGALSYDADGNGAGAATQFATLTAGLALSNNDFLIV